MSSEVFSSTNSTAAWTTLSDIWVLLNPDENQWTEEIDWSLGMLIRRAFVRLESKPAPRSEALLLAAPEGMPAPRVLVLRDAERDEWLRELGPILTKMKVKTATVFAPREWRPPQVKTIAEISGGEWGLRWVDSVTP